MRKIRLTVTNLVAETIEYDAKLFQISKNLLYNNIFKKFYDKKGYKKLEKEHTVVIQFNLNKTEERLLESVWDDFNCENSLAEYFRYIFDEYGKLSRAERERLIHKDNIDKLEEQIKHKKNVIISYNNRVEEIEPLFIQYDKDNQLYYLCGYLIRKNMLLSYRVSGILMVEKKETKQIYGIENKKFISELKRNFDPFLSYNQKVIIKFTENGKKLLDKFRHNKPKLISNENDLYIFESSELKAQLFFSGFWDDAEIVEPKSLRDWFIDKAKKTFEKYSY
ncbi:WYL domain-containing protein [bacterium]|nr:WYL domain-containing protein [bacterium]